MKATFATSEPNILLEAKPGDLFTPMGPRLVECVCALRSRMTIPDGIQPDCEREDRDNPDACMPVVVLACRIGQGEPEYHPAGYTTWLPAATPIAFLEQVEPLALRPRTARGDADAAIDRIVAAANRDMRTFAQFTAPGATPYR